VEAGKAGGLRGIHAGHPGRGHKARRLALAGGSVTTADEATGEVEDAVAAAAERSRSGAPVGTAVFGGTKSSWAGRLLGNSSTPHHIRMLSALAAILPPQALRAGAVAGDAGDAVAEGGSGTDRLPQQQRSGPGGAGEASALLLRQLALDPQGAAFEAAAGALAASQGQQPLALLAAAAQALPLAGLGVDGDAAAGAAASAAGAARAARKASEAAAAAAGPSATRTPTSTPAPLPFRAGVGHPLSPAWQADAWFARSQAALLHSLSVLPASWFLPGGPLFTHVPETSAGAGAGGSAAPPAPRRAGPAVVVVGAGAEEPGHAAAAAAAAAASAPSQGAAAFDAASISRRVDAALGRHSVAPQLAGGAASSGGSSSVAGHISGEHRATLKRLQRVQAATVQRLVEGGWVQPPPPPPLPAPAPAASLLEAGAGAEGGQQRRAGREGRTKARRGTTSLARRRRRAAAARAAARAAAGGSGGEGNEEGDEDILEASAEEEAEAEARGLVTFEHSDEEEEEEDAVLRGLDGDDEEEAGASADGEKAGPGVDPLYDFVWQLVARVRGRQAEARPQHVWGMAALLASRFVPHCGPAGTAAADAAAPAAAAAPAEQAVVSEGRGGRRQAAGASVGASAAAAAPAQDAGGSSLHPLLRSGLVSDLCSHLQAQIDAVEGEGEGEAFSDDDGDSQGEEGYGQQRAQGWQGRDINSRASRRGGRKRTQVALPAGASSWLLRSAVQQMVAAAEADSAAAATASAAAAGVAALGEQAPVGSGQPRAGKPVSGSASASASASLPAWLATARAPLLSQAQLRYHSAPLSLATAHASNLLANCLQSWPEEGSAGGGGGGNSFGPGSDNSGRGNARSRPESSSRQHQHQQQSTAPLGALSALLPFAGEVYLAPFAGVAASGLAPALPRGHAQAAAAHAGRPQHLPATRLLLPLSAASKQGGGGASSGAAAAAQPSVLLAAPAAYLNALAAWQRNACTQEARKGGRPAAPLVRLLTASTAAHPLALHLLRELQGLQAAAAGVSDARLATSLRWARRGSDEAAALERLLWFRGLARELTAAAEEQRAARAAKQARYAAARAGGGSEEEAPALLFVAEPLRALRDRAADLHRLRSASVVHTGNAAAVEGLLGLWHKEVALASLLVPSLVPPALLAAGAHLLPLNTMAPLLRQTQGAGRSAPDVIEGGQRHASGNTEAKHPTDAAAAAVAAAAAAESMRATERAYGLQLGAFAATGPSRGLGPAAFTASAASLMLTGNAFWALAKVIGQTNSR
jgi:hypothetical protein